MEASEILILRHQFAVLQRQQPRRPNLTSTGNASSEPVCEFCAAYAQATAAHFSRASTHSVSWRRLRTSVTVSQSTAYSPILESVVSH